MKRRKFLGFLAASPIAAKQAAEKAAAELSNVDLNGFQKEPTGGPSASPIVDQSSTVRRLLAINGIPDWKMQELRENARHVSRIDPNVAALRSVSLAGKVAMQRNRNFETERSRFVAHWLSPSSLVQDAWEFRQKYGWPF